MTQAEQPVEDRDEGTYASFETADGDLVIYSRDDPTAWYQSDTVAAVDDWQ